MSFRNPSLVATLLAVAGCNQAAPPKTAPSAKPTAAKAAQVGYALSLYRGVRTLPGTNNVDWSRMSFSVSGNPPVLTLFASMTAIPGGPNAFPCWVRVPVTVPGNPPSPQPAPGSVATLAAPNPGMGGASPGPWNVLFDNNPAGHWSIAKTTIASQPVSNAAASTMAGLTFQGLVASGNAAVLNGSYPNCLP